MSGNFLDGPDGSEWVGGASPYDPTEPAPYVEGGPKARTWHDIFPTPDGFTGGWSNDELAWRKEDDGPVDADYDGAMRLGEISGLHEIDTAGVDEAEFDPTQAAGDMLAHHHFDGGGHPAPGTPLADLAD